MKSQAGADSCTRYRKCAVGRYISVEHIARCVDAYLARWDRPLHANTRCVAMSFVDSLHQQLKYLSRALRADRRHIRLR